MENAEPSLSGALLDWYENSRRDLPWRRRPDPYRVWVSEVMLQQTRVETVLPYYRRFLERFPSVEDLAAADDEEVLALWSGLGYYRRARSLLEGARQLVDRFDGRFPRSLDEALELPGVGSYTAAAVLSIAYGLPHPVVDGNVERVVARLLRLEGNPRQVGVARKIRSALESWIPDDRAGDFNQALMELGATVCKPGRPPCSRCPLERLCASRRHGDSERFPELPPPRRTEDVILEAGLLFRRGRYLMERPVDLGYLDALWVFPLADVSAPRSSSPTAGEPPPPGIAGRLSRKLGVEVRESGQLPELRHSVTFRRITVRPRLLESGPLGPGRRRNFRWARLEELGETVPVSSMCLKIARNLRRENGTPRSAT